ncbi:MFS transporter [Aspergillus glaucus CBS 516.65]|uniref:Major facilitator superfamily (MFS) profile domain-containing protein n=1 Tax=Aspergillus glaucus CBS 516.65 TaxID=1160497 RepID=A0A1L9VX64_ASPGL|nr:hypothetical protein ASPGLDRAFT_141043 [Aspergillus glaucus CBS 516.65]OJJ88496.1 hypothetical protein ASPGLDRAFT_141043 [Aspergillus glaucus CBS 516.65]
MPWGYRWRASRWLIFSTMTVALFAETFLFGFLVPILSYMLEGRLHLDPSRTQPLTSTLFTVHGFFGLISAPVIAHFADKSPNRKIPLLIALAGCFVGTLMIALTHSLVILFIGRIFQAISGSAAWVVGFAVLSDIVPVHDLGKTMGIAMSFVTAGIVGGPMVGGTMFQLFGYWPAWSVPLIVLVLDIIARLIMIEPRTLQPSPSYSGKPDSTPGETTGLLSGDSPSNAQDIHENVDDETALEPPSAPRGFYRVMLREPRVWTGLASLLMTSSLMSSFNNTLPAHLRDAFGWGSLPIGMMFLCLQAPSMVLGGPFGMIRDRCGLRIPNAIGWFLSAPLLWLLGIAGNPNFPWVGDVVHGKSLFTCCMVGLGTALILVRGAGAIQMTCVVRELQAKDPLIFGHQSGSSRVFSTAEVVYSLGMTIGPMISGLLFEKVGFHLMNVVFGKYNPDLHSLSPADVDSYYMCCNGQPFLYMA